MFAQPFIDSVVFARNGNELQGVIPLASLPRVSEMLVDAAGDMSYQVRGSKEGDRLMLELELEGVCQLRCQRCLDVLSYPIKVKSNLQLLSLQELSELEVDDVDGIEASAQLDLLALIEDEVLLDLPFSPRHPDGFCSSVVESLEDSAGPFAVLAGLKVKK